MSMIQSDLLLGQEGGGGYVVERSLRFNSSDSAYLSRTPASAGNRKTWTWAGWVKRSRLNNGSGEQFLFECFNALNSSQCLNITFFSGDQLSIGSDIFFLQTSSVYRDLSAWYHIVLAVDTTQATANNRIRLYVNGSEVTQFSTRNNPSQNADLAVNQAALHAIGKRETAPYASSPFDGYLADIHFIDGQALDPSSFTEVSATTGQLIPKAYTGSFGTNGFWLKFSDNSAATATTLGKDYSGNSNNWTPNNLSIVTGGPTSVAAASGALPIYNTTDTYGAVKGTGTRTDANNSSIVLAVPMDGANNGTTFTDEAPTIKGSGSAKTITPNGDVKTNTALSKYYGSSGYFDGTGDYLTAGTSSDYTFGTGDFAVECFVYFNASGTYQDIFSTANYNSNNLSVRRNNSNQLEYYINDGSPAIGTGATMPAGKWYHIAITRSSGTVRLFVDGVTVHTATQTFNFSTSGTFTIGRVPGNPLDLNGYLQDFRIYKGVAKYTGNFNPPSSTQNPTIAAGNDSLVDTPTSYGTDTGAGGEVRGNYATWNPLDAATPSSLSNGNLDQSGGNNVRATIGGIGSGKWYWEFTKTSTRDGSGTNIGSIGVFPNTTEITALSTFALLRDDGLLQENGSSIGTYSTWTNGDVMGVAMNNDTAQYSIYKNGSLLFTRSYPSGITAANATPAIRNNTGQSGATNFGQRPFAYTAPSGFKALVDTNLTAPVIAKPSTAMDVALWTGDTSTTRSITGLNFSPDLVWIKNRGSVYWNVLFDAVRGAGNQLSSNQTDAELASASNVAGKVSSFDANGFTLAAGSSGIYTVNENAKGHVAWAWDAGSSTVTNTQGSITSQVRTNGYLSIVTYTGNGTNPGATIGHGLGVTPGLIITKSRSGTGEWPSYHSALPVSNTVYLNATYASTTYVNRFSAVSSTTFTTGSSGSELNTNGVTYVAYCFAPVAGYSSFGSYTGNGSTDGPFVYTGMRPKYILIKRTDAAEDWAIRDTSRSPFNASTTDLAANQTYGDFDSTGNSLDILSNGFKPRNTRAMYNASGGTYVWATFAENPFAYARAR